jgi:hypothetical protein
MTIRAENSRPRHPVTSARRSLAKRKRVEMALPTDPALVKSCAIILLSPFCQMIDFYWRGQQINGQGFRAVTLALMDARIGVKKIKMEKGVGAKYNFDRHVMMLRLNIDFTDFETQMQIAHEGAHAMQDIQAAGDRSRLDEEAAAYVAGALYNVYYPKFKNGSYHFTPRGAIFETAHKVAQRIALNRHEMIDPILMSPLQDAIRLHPVYAQQLIDYPFVEEDGISAPAWP